MHQLLLDYAASRGRVFLLPFSKHVHDKWFFFNVIYCINCMFELSLHLFMKKYIPALETLCLWFWFEEIMRYFSSCHLDLFLSVMLTRHASVFKALSSVHTLHPQALVLFMSLRLLVHLSLSPSLFSYMTHLSAFCEISASLQAHAGWTKCESEQSVTTLNWELLHCQNTALYTYGGSLQRHKVM